MTIHLDTNALLASVLTERHRDRAKTTDWIQEHGTLTVGESVLAETCWVLERVYMHPRRDVARLLQVALESEELTAWDPQLADWALSLMHSDPKLSIVDCILAARTLSGDLVCTFDRRLSRTIESL